jgi:DNA-binding PadR family transcriptional regulator
MNDFTRLTPEQGFHVYGWMRTMFDLKGTDLELFAIVYSYTQNGGEIGGLRFFTEWTGATRPTVINSLQKLEQAGLITAVETKNGRLKKYTVGDTARKQIETYKNDGEPVKNFNQSNNLTSKDSLPPPVKNLYPHQLKNETPTSKNFLPASKIESKIDNKQERKIDNNYRITQPPREEEPPLVQAAMQPPEAPEFHEVYNAMLKLLVRPMGTELEKCAHAFYDLKEQQGWSGNWKSHASRYAASWAAKVRNLPPQREKPRPCQPDDPVQDFGEIPW